LQVGFRGVSFWYFYGLSVIDSIRSRTEYIFSSEEEEGEEGREIDDSRIGGTLTT
jgi:hypothetical protein